MKLALLLAVFGTCSCGVLATPGSGGQNLPDARLGPWRKLDDLEVTLAPFVLLDFRSTLGGPSALRIGSQTVLYYHAIVDDESTTVILRSTSDNPVEFARDEIVLSPVGWEGEGVVDPDVLLAEEGETLLFYAAASGDGIGLARSSGGPFEREQDAPVLPRGGDAEDVGAPSVLYRDDELWMYFVRGKFLHLAISGDVGRSWEERGVVLEPDPERPWESGALDDPEAAPYRSALGRESIRLYYSGRDADDTRVTGVGVAASWDGAGDFSRSLQNPLVGVDRGEQAPAALELTDGAIYYYAQASGGGRVGIAAAVCPAELRFDKE